MAEIAPLLRVVDDLLPDAKLRVPLVRAPVRQPGKKPMRYEFEANLVFGRPAGMRVNAMRSRKEDRLRADAHALADFLGLPLLDHTGGRGQPADGAADDEDEDEHEDEHEDE